MTPETVSAIQKALEPIAAKIGQGAQFGWETVVYQQYLSGLTHLMVAGFSSIAVVIGIVMIVTAVRMPKTKNWQDDTVFTDAAASMLLAGICLQMAWVVVIGTLSQGILMMLNPAYYALDFFIHLAK